MDATEPVRLRTTEKLSVVCQLDDLLPYPFIASNIAKGKLAMHGWIYDVANGGFHFSAVVCPSSHMVFVT